jgi:glycosyltransferase involved in cell wall biosynthesis
MDSHDDRQRVLLVTPSLDGLGGVANYFRTMLPWLENGTFSIDHLEIGSFNGRSAYFYPVYDQMRLRERAGGNVALVHLNPSLNLKSFIREGGFLLQAKRRRLRVLVFFRGWNREFARFLNRGMLPIVRGIYGKADAFIVLASEIEDTLRKWGIEKPVYRETTVVDTELLEAFDPGERLARIAETRAVRVLYLARLEREKGVFETVDAVRLLRSRNFPVELSIAGDGPARPDLAEYVMDQNLPEGVIRFLGYLRGPDKAEVFRRHDLYCLPTYHDEGMPNSVLEALAFGMPVITCAVAGLKDIFQDGRMGRLVPVRDPAAVAEAIRDLAGDKYAMARIACTNTAYAAANVTAPRVAKRLQTLYQETIAGC